MDPDLTFENPWDSEEGRRARENRFRRLAGGTGPIADFAADVVAGRRAPHELLTHAPAAEEINKRFGSCAKLWDRLAPAGRGRLAEQAPEIIRRMVTEHAGKDGEAQPPAESRPSDVPRAAEPPRARRRPRPTEDELDDEAEAFNGPFLLGRRPDGS